MSAETQELEVEYQSGKDSGILITEGDQPFFLPCKRHEIEKWVFKNGDNEHHYEWVEDWSGGYRSAVPEIIEDNWDESLRMYTDERRADWIKVEQ